MTKEVVATIDVDGPWVTVNGERVMLIVQAQAFGDMKKAFAAVLARYFNEPIGEIGDFISTEAP